MFYAAVDIPRPGDIANHRSLDLDPSEVIGFDASRTNDAYGPVYPTVRGADGQSVITVDPADYIFTRLTRSTHVELCGLASRVPIVDEVPNTDSPRHVTPVFSPEVMRQVVAERMAGPSQDVFVWNGDTLLFTPADGAAGAEDDILVGLADSDGTRTIAPDKDGNYVFDIGYPFTDASTGRDRGLDPETIEMWQDRGGRWFLSLFTLDDGNAIERHFEPSCAENLIRGLACYSFEGVRLVRETEVGTRIYTTV